MQFYLLSDNLDTLIGMRLAGAGGELVKNPEDLKETLRKILEREDIAVILLTSKLVSTCKDYILNVKLNLKKPLIVEIPGNTDISESGKSIVDYIHKTTGMDISF